MNFRSLLSRINVVSARRAAAPMRSGGLCVKAASQSGPGGRPENEDHCLVKIPVEGEPSFSRGWLAIVSDGMGGHNAGGVASRLAVDCVIRKYYESTGTPARSLRSAVFAANRCIRSEARREKHLSGMGATCTVLAGIGDSALMAHVGDSRLYLLRDGVISQLSEDHSAHARSQERRNIVFRALGAERDVAVAEWDAPLSMLPADRFILCTDGLSNALGDEDILHAAADADCETACQALMELAAERQASDNVTVVVVDLFSQPVDAAVTEESRLSELTP